MPPQWLVFVGIVSIAISVSLIFTARAWLTNGFVAYDRDGRSWKLSMKRRFAAYGLDVLTVLCLTSVLASTYGPAARLVAPILIVVVAILYAALSYRFADATVGQRIAGLRRPIRASRSDVLAGCSVVGFLLMLFGFPFGLLPLLFDRERRGVEEVIAGMHFTEH